MGHLSTFKARQHLNVADRAELAARVGRWERRRRLSRWMDRWGYPLIGVALCCASIAVMVWVGALAAHYVVQSWR